MADNAPSRALQVSGDPPDREVQGLLASARGSGLPPLHLQGVAQAREQLRRAREGLAPGPDVFATKEFFIPGAGGGIPARRYQPTPQPAAGLIVYFHGGGWVLGGLDESDALCRTLAMESGCEVVSVGYRLAPEHRFPAAVEDADAAVTWLVASRPRATKTILVGDSAGGTLAAVVARRARDRGEPDIALQVLVYPVTDHRMATASYEKYRDAFLVTADDMKWFWETYAPEVADRESPDASPLLVGDLTGLPPALILIAEYDVLRDECIAYAERLDDAGVEVTVERYEAMIHGFLPLLGVLTAAKEAVDSIAATAADVVGRASF